MAQEIIFQQFLFVFYMIDSCIPWEDGMNWLTDEALFYGGLALIIVVLILWIVYMIISNAAISRLRRKMDLEYGSEQIDLK